MPSDWVVQQAVAPKTGPFKMIEGLPAIITMDEDGIETTVSTDRAALPALVEIARRNEE